MFCERKKSKIIDLVNGDFTNRNLLFAKIYRIIWLYEEIVDLAEFICISQKKVVPLQALQMTKVLHMSKKSCIFATEIETTDVKSTNVPD